VTRLNFCASYACTGIDWLAFAVKLLVVGNFYRECQPIKWECYLCTRSQHGSLHVSQGRKIEF